MQTSIGVKLWQSSGWSTYRINKEVR